MYFQLIVYELIAVSLGWNTYVAQPQSCVIYGLSPNSLRSKACSDSPPSTYQTSRTFSQSVLLSNLLPATHYYYKIISTNSSIESFFSPRPAGDQTPFSFDVVVDLGVYGENGFTVSNSGVQPYEENSPLKRDSEEPLRVDPELNHTTIQRLAINFNSSQFCIHPGDFGYADGWPLKSHGVKNYDGIDAYQVILEQFYDQLAPIASRKPYMVGPGNHEAKCALEGKEAKTCPIGQNNFTDFLHRFDRTMPAAFPSASKNHTARQSAAVARRLANPPFWYSFEYGMAHIVMLDTETDIVGAPDVTNVIHGFGRKEQQRAFLEADLASVDRTVTPWLLTAGHRPWYGAGGNLCSQCRDYFEDIFYGYGVDMAIFGHVHNTQRFYPVYRGVSDKKRNKDPVAPAYIISGGAGNIEGIHPIGPKPPYTAFTYDDDFAYTTIHIVDRNHMIVDFIRSATGEVIDTSTLYKSHKTPFVSQHASEAWSYHPDTRLALGGFVCLMMMLCAFCF